MLVAGTQGYAEFSMAQERLTVTSPSGADVEVNPLPSARSVVADWLEGGDLVDQAASLRANRLSILATISADAHRRIEL